MIATAEGRDRLSSPAPSGLGACVPAGSEPVSKGRETFVLGIFSAADAAGSAIRHLGAALENGGDALLMAPDSRPGQPGDARHPFAALWASLDLPEGTEAHAATSHGTAWLRTQLKRRLAEGASVVVARTDGPGQQLAVSRALLEAGCDVLLAHDVTSHGSGTAGNPVHNPVIFP